MESFGSFEATEVAREGNFGVIMYARRAGGGDKKFAIKVFRPPDFLMDESQIDQEAQSFLESARTQQQAAVAAPGAWAPVYEMGTCSGGAWYATDLLECSVEWLRITQKDLEPEHIRKIMEPVVQGLVVLKQSQGRAHGNLKATNVLVQGRADILRARIVMCDPKPTSRCKSPEDDQADARDLGNLVHQLILHRQFQNATEWPLQSSDRWQRLGRAGAAWLDLVNKLIDPTTTSKPSIQEVAAMLPGGAVAIPSGIKSPAQAEAERKAREEKAKEEEERRRKNEAEIARKVREQAEKDAQAKAAAELKAREEAQRKAEAERRAREDAERRAAEEAERKAREAEAARKAQEEAARRAKEDEEKRRAEQERLDAQARAAEAERRSKEQERRAQEEEKKARDEAARREKEEADRRTQAAQAAEAERAAKLKAEEKAKQDALREAQEQRKAQEQAQKAQEEAARRKAAEEAAKAKAAEAAARKAEQAAAVAAKAAEASVPVAEASPAAPSPRKPAPAPLESPAEVGEPSAPKAGSGKKGILAVAALVAVAGTVGAIMMFRGGSPPTDPTPKDGPGPISQVPTPPVDPPTPPVNPNLDPKQDPTPPVTPGPAKPTEQEIAAAASRLGRVLDQRIATELAVAASEEVARHRQSVANTLTLAATAEADKVAKTAETTQTPAQVRASALRAAEGAVRSGFATGLNPPAPTRQARPALTAIATDLESSIRKELPGAEASVVAQRSADALDDAIKRLWPDALAKATAPGMTQAATDLAGPAADSAMASFTERVKPPVPPKDDPSAITEADLQKVREAVRAITVQLDGGDAAGDGGAAARTALGALPGLKGYDRVVSEPEIERTIARVAAVERIARADAAGILQEVQQASGQGGGASELIASWNRLGSVGSSVDLQQVAQARTDAKARVANLDAAVRTKALRAVDDAARTLWTASAGSAGDDTALTSAKTLQRALEIPDQSISPELQFNFALLEFKDAIRKVTATGDQRAQALRAPSTQFVQKIESLAPIANESLVQSALQWAQAIVNPPAPAAGPGDPSRSGPGAVGWQAEVGDGGDRVTFTLAASGTRFKEEKLTFFRVGNSYLCSTEVPVSLFRRLFNDPAALDDLRANYTDPPNGLKVWRVANRAVELNPQLAKTPDIDTPQKLQEWAGRPPSEINPQLSWPVDYISPKAAAVVAGKLGCRLPTADEWKAAVQQEQGGTRNLRDSNWFSVLASSRTFKYNGAPVPPDGESVVRERPPAQNPTADDGYPFFAPVDAQGFGTKWKHLQGNVAEWVFASPPQGAEPVAANMAAVNSAWTYAVVGGSAVSPPGISQPDQIVTDHKSKAWFDVGVRPAFSAPGGIASGPSVDSQIDQLVAMQYLPSRSR